MPKGDFDDIIDVGEAIRYYDNKSAETLVWFSGLHEPFLPAKVLLSAGINGLLIKDDRFDWYTGGIVGLGEGYQDAENGVRAFLAERPATVTIGGQSSGGYAALRMAHALKPSLCVVFSPQTGNLYGQPAVALPPLLPLYAGQPHGFPIVVHLARSEKENVGGFRWHDWQQIAPFLEMDDVTVVRHPFDLHAVSLPLYGKARFLETIVSDMRLYAPVPRA